MENQQTNQQENTFDNNGALDFSSDSGGVIDFSDFIAKDTDVSRETSTKDLKIEIETPEIKEEEIQTPTEEEEESTPTSEEEESTPTSEEEEEEEIQTPTEVTGGVDYKRLFNQMIEDNGWEAVEEIETEEGVIKFEDLEVSEEVFRELVTAKRIEENNKLTEGKLDAKGMSDFTKQLIEIEKEGGNPVEVLQMYNQVNTPLDNLDLTKEEDQQTAYMMRLQAQGMDEKTAVKVINASVVDGSLAEEAEESVRMLKEASKAQIDAYQEQVRKANEERKENLKVYRNSFKEQVANFDVSESFKRKLIEAATKPDENGSYKADNIYNELRKDPVKFAEVALYLTDREQFIKQVSKEEVKKDQIKTFSRLKLTSRKGGTTPDKDKQTPTTGVIDLPNT